VVESILRLPESVPLSRLSRDCELLVVAQQREKLPRELSSECGSSICIALFLFLYLNGVNAASCGARSALALPSDNMLLGTPHDIGVNAECSQDPKLQRRTTYVYGIPYYPELLVLLRCDAYSTSDRESPSTRLMIAHMHFEAPDLIATTLGS
jgi:hypothetical protein